MDDSTKLIEPLLEKAVDYGKISLELAKLKALDKTSDVVSSIVPNLFVLILIASFLLFISLGCAFWLGEVLGKSFYGLFLVAAFYGMAAIILHFFMHKWFKINLRNYLINQMLK